MQGVCVEIVNSVLLTGKTVAMEPTLLVLVAVLVALIVPASVVATGDCGMTLCKQEREKN